MNDERLVDCVKQTGFQSDGARGTVWIKMLLVFMNPMPNGTDSIACTAGPRFTTGECRFWLPRSDFGSHTAQRIARMMGLPGAVGQDPFIDNQVAGVFSEHSPTKPCVAQQE